MNIVDRRPNPKGKSLSNRQRFLARARVEVKSAVQEALRKRKVADIEHGEKVAIPTRGISEPIFHHNRRTGRTDHVVPGNKEYVRGDEIPRPQRRRRAGRPGGQPGRRRRGRVRVHAVEGRVPRHVLRGPRTARPRQKEPQGHHRLRSAARRLHGHRQPVQPQHPAHDAQQHGAPHFAAAAQARPNWRRCARRSTRRGRGATTRKPSGSLHRARSARAAQQDHPLHRPDRCPLPALRPRAEARTPRRSCSA